MLLHVDYQIVSDVLKDRWYILLYRQEVWKEAAWPINPEYEESAFLETIGQNGTYKTT
jgi:hypothetical protein